MTFFHIIGTSIGIRAEWFFTVSHQKNYCVFPPKYFTSCETDLKSVAGFLTDFQKRHQKLFYVLPGLPVHMPK